MDVNEELKFFELKKNIIFFFLGGGGRGWGGAGSVGGGGVRVDVIEVFGKIPQIGGVGGGVGSGGGSGRGSGWGGVRVDVNEELKFL